jgi:hypothetical protein
MPDQTITANPDTVNVTAPPPAPPQDSQTAPDPSQAGMIQPTPPPDYTNPQSTYQPPGPDPNADPEVHAGAVSHARSAGVLSGVLRALAGPRSYKAITNQDGSVDVHEMPSTRGEQWRRILGAALEGASKGFAAGQGPGGLAHAASAGIDAGLQQPYQQADRVQAQAAQANDQNRKQQLFKANMAMFAQNAAKGAWELTNEQRKAGEEIEALQQSFDQYRENAHLKKIGDAPDVEHGAQMFNANPEVQQAIADGRLIIHTNYDAKTRQATGASVYVRPVVASNQMWDKPATHHNYSVDEKGDITDEPYTVDAGYNTHEQEQAATNNDIRGHNLAVDQGAKIKDTIAQSKEREAQGRRAGAVAAAQLEQLKLQNNALPGSPADLLSDSMERGDLAPSLLKRAPKGGPDPNTIISMALQKHYARTGQQFSPDDLESQYRANKQIQTDYSGDGKAAVKINDMSAMLGHLGDFVESVEKVRNSGIPALNTPINAALKKFGNTTVGPALISANVASHQHANVINDNRALSNEQKTALKDSLNENMTLAQGQENSKAMAKTAIRQLAPLFQSYRSARRGQESPTQLTDEAKTRLQQMGLWDEAVKAGIVGKAPQAPVVNHTPQTSSFSKSAWLQKHPGGDVDSMAKQATAAGYPVVN